MGLGICILMIRKKMNKDGQRKIISLSFLLLEPWVKLPSQAPLLQVRPRSRVPEDRPWVPEPIPFPNSPLPLRTLCVHPAHSVPDVPPQHGGCGWGLAPHFPLGSQPLTLHQLACRLLSDGVGAGWMVGDGPGCFSPSDALCFLTGLGKPV